MNVTGTHLKYQKNIDLDYYEIISRRATLRPLETFTTARPSRDERLAMGKSIRSRVPRSAHADFNPSKKRRNPVSVLVEQNATRIKKLVPLRMARMAASPFSFFRGAAAVMAADLQNTATSGIDVMACGDMHLANFGIFGSAERNLVFAINDFDEVHPGPWEWDVKRLAASAALASLFLGGDRVHSGEAARKIVRSYQRRIRRYAQMGFLEVWYDLIDERSILDAIPPRLQSKARAIINKARAKGHMRALDRLTEEVDGAHRIADDAPLIVHETHLSDGTPIEEALDLMLRSYVASLPQDRCRLLSRYRIVDVARKVVGVGSVGTGCWVIMLRGLDLGDPLFLQVKEARASVLEPYVKSRFPITNPGQRVAIGQRMIQGSPDIFLGWGPAGLAEGQPAYYVRQLSDMKGGMRLIEGRTESLDGLHEYCGLCGWALALAHAKSGDPAMISGYCGTGDALPDAIARFAAAYVERTERDHDALARAVSRGQIQVAEFA